MTNKCVLLLCHSIRLDTGGFNSALELIQALYEKGCQTHLLLIRPDRKHKKRIEELKKQIDFRLNIHYVPSFSQILKVLTNSNNNYLNSELTFPSNSNKLKAFINSFLYSLYPSNHVEIESLLKQANVIIKAVGLSGTELKALRKTTSAIIIQNHAGSPKAYEDYWLTEEQRPIDSNPKLPLYTSFCLAFDKILFQSEDQAIDCASRHVDLKDKVVVVPPTCNEKKIDEAKLLSSPFKDIEGLINIINIGSIQPRKAQHISIEVFYELTKNRKKQYFLHFLGQVDSKNKKYFKRLLTDIKKFELEKNVLFHGFRKDYLRYMVNADFLIQTSNAEGVSRVLRESMYMKLPVISFSIPGTKELFIDIEDGYLAMPGNLKDLLSKLEEAIDDKRKTKMLVDLAFNKYQNKHSGIKFKTNIDKLLM